jgi:uncharacterized Zn finger protein (UPF0148 family)
MTLFNFFWSKSQKCPYCGVLIDKEPKGKFKCPTCKEEIHIQKLGDKNKLIKKSEYEAFKSEKKKIAEENKYYRFFQYHDLSRSYLERRKIDWFNKFKENANYPDLIWSISNELLNTYAKSNDYFNMKMLYFEMALFQKKENKKFLHLLQESRKMELYDIRKQMSKEFNYKVVIVGGELDCQVCKELDGKAFSIKEALDKMPIPPKDCTHDKGWCTCCYATEIE